MNIDIKKSNLDGRLIQIRERQEILDAFYNVCKLSGVSASEVVRYLIREIVSGDIKIRDISNNT